MELAQAECLDYRIPGMSGSSGVLPALHTTTPSVETLSDHFTVVVERYQTPLISFLYGMVGDREHAEDLAQETLIKAYEAMQRRRANQVFTSGWLFRIARNAAIDALRRRRLISWLPFGPEHESSLPVRGDFAGQLAERELVHQVLAQLPARYRECLMLRSVVGMSNGEIAVAMGISIRNVNTTLFRARERFKVILQQMEGVTGPRLEDPRTEPMDVGGPR
ncbi:MAG: polymerase sigma factor [Chloroflexi bacterium]|nr:polymerase sigma factor [Chloroflexota bacterium]MDB5076897.1 polymerase sigma factor [Chloroflexota bacterium]